MLDFWKNIIWQQYGATIDMLENAITACPDDLWDQESKFWYIAYHTLFFLDYHSSDDADSFMPPQPFTLSEMDPSGLMPDRVYSKAELLDYLEYGRNKCHDKIKRLTANNIETPIPGNYKEDYSQVEIQLYNMRHVQHHTAQLKLLLRQNGNEPPKWVSRAKKQY